MAEADAGGEVMGRHHSRMPYTRPLTSLFATLVAFAAIFAVCAAPATARPAPFFVHSPHGPYRLGDAPVAVMNGDLDPRGLGFDDYLIGYARGKSANLFYSSRSRPGRLLKLDSFAAPTGPSAFGEYRGNQFAILSSGSDQVRVFYANPFRDWRIEGREALPTGRQPVAAVFGDFAYGPEGTGGIDLAVVNRLSRDLWLYDGDHWGNITLAAKVPLGPEPTAAVRAECCGPTLYVTTAGDDRVTLLRDFQDGDFQTRRSYPAGDGPAALVLGDLVVGDSRDDEIAVANRGSDTVTVLDDPARGVDFRRVGTYPVGDEPMAIVSLNVDDRGGWDLAVANAGSDSISILLGDGRGGFRPGGTYRVGKRPVALAATSFNRFFGPDLAVVNRGSDTLSVLLRHEVGRCQGSAARLRQGTAGDDLLEVRAGGPDELRGLGGDDEIHGYYGDDCLLGGRGEDHLDGGYGSDLILARDGEPDRVECGEGIGRDRDRVVADRRDQVSGCEIRG